MKNLIFFVISMFIFSFPLFGQENISVSKRKEVAFTNISLGGASILLKKEVKPNVFIRNAFGYGRIQASKNQNVSGFNSSLNYSIGKEKRKNLIKSLDFIHGPQYGLGVSFAQSKTKQNTIFQNTSFEFTPSFSYLLGIIYHFSDKIYVGLETAPYISTSFQYVKTTNQPTRTELTGLQFGASNYLGITAGYRFK